jgi:hypothetical protein
MNEVAKQDKNYNPVSLGVTADVNQDITQMRTNAAGDALLVEVTNPNTGGLINRGNWNASTNTPTIVSGVGTTNEYYKVSVAGNTIIDGVGDWQITDLILFDGTVWIKIDNTDGVVNPTALWGTIGGTLSAQTDLQTALNKKIQQGGNSFGLDMTIGTNDDYDVVFERNNIFKGRIGASTLALGGSAGVGGGISSNNFIGSSSGFNSSSTGNSIFIGGFSGAVRTSPARGSINASNSIFIGREAGSQTTDTALNNSFFSTDSSILVGDYSSTGGFSNSIAIGKNAVNTAANQFLVGSSYTQLNMRGVNYTMPSAQGAASTVLSNDGSGNLTWVVPSSSGVTGTGVNGAITLWNGTSTVTADSNYTFSTANSKLTQTLTGTPIANANSWYEGTRTLDGVTQFNIRNASNGTSASTGFIATGDNGSDAANFTEFGRNSSTYNVAAQNFVLASAGYILQDTGDFGVAVANGTYYLAVGGTTTTQRKTAVSNQTHIFTNNGYSHTWTNATNSTWGSDSMTSSVAARTVDLRAQYTQYTGGGATGTAWYNNVISSSSTPGANVTSGSQLLNRILSTSVTNSGRTVSLTDLVGTYMDTVVTATGTLSVSGYLVGTRMTFTGTGTPTASRGAYTLNVSSPNIGSYAGIRGAIATGAVSGGTYTGISTSANWDALLGGHDGVYLGKAIVGRINGSNPGTNPQTSVDLNVVGTFALGGQLARLTGNHTATGTSSPVMEVDATSGNITITLPQANITQDRTFIITRVDTSVNTVTVATAGGNINGVASITIPAAVSGAWPSRWIRKTADGLDYKTIN